MKKLIALIPVALLSTSVQADTAYGALGNFDTVNDTGQKTYGFEIEIDDVHSTAIGGTYNYNHYGVPKIREDNTDPAHPKVFVTYRATGLSNTVTGFTNYAAPGTISPTQGHQCTNPSVNLGCEHFGIGIYNSNYTAIKYNWLDANGQHLPNNIGVVHVSSPVFTNYQPPVIAQPAVKQPNPVPNLPPIIVQPAVVNFPAQVQAVIPAPQLVIPAAKRFGDPSWVKVIKTTTHNARHVPLEDLVGDLDANNNPLWANGEPAEVESEWYLLQTNNGANAQKSELAGNPDDIGDGNDVTTRRYEFYAYAAGNLSIDGENGEAMCDTVNPANLHGVGTVSVADANGNSYDFDCSAVTIVGAYQGAQMGEFNGATPLDVVTDVQTGNVGEAYPQRKILVGGDTPYNTTVSGSIPEGLSVDPTTGILYGVPAKVGIYQFRVESTDNFGSKVDKNVGLSVTGPGDVNVDFKIDTTDLNSIKAKYGQVVAAKNPADLNGDLKVNLLDYRKAASLCTNPRCAP